MEFPAELFQTLNDDAVKVLPANMENSAMATGLEKVSFQANPKERQCQRMFRLPHSCTHFTAFQSALLFSRWDASQFMNGWIKPIRSSDLLGWIFVSRGEGGEVRVEAVVGSG